MRDPWAAIGLVAILVGGSPAAGGDAPVEAFEVPLPGPLTGMSAAVAEGGSDLYLLVGAAEESEERPSLLRFGLSPEPRLVVLGAGLPPGADEIAVMDPRGGEGPEVFVGDGERIWRLGPVRDPGEPRSVALGPGSLEAIGGAGPGLRKAPAVVAAGVLRIAARAGDPESEEGPGTAGRSTGFRDVPIPMRVERRSWGLRLTSPSVVEVGSGWLVGPEEAGDGRLETLLVDRDGEVSRSWARLPEGTRFRHGSVIVGEDGPLLLAWTSPGGPLAKLRLAVYPLRTDRSRAGNDPVLELETDTRSWYEPVAAAADIDGDGDRDLVVAAPEGLGAGELEVFAIPRIGRDRFGEPRKTKIPYGDGGIVVGRDVTGDGWPDLLTVSGDLLRIRAGGPGGEIADQPGWTIPLERRSGDDGSRSRRRGLRAEDLDGDGAREVVVVWEDPDGRGRLTVYRLSTVDP